LLSCVNRRTNDPEHILAEADRLAMLFNWPRAAPLYLRAQSLFAESGDKRNALDAGLGYIWATADQGANPALSAEVDRVLQDAAIQSDPRLALHSLIARAALDRERNEASGRESWQKILELAKTTGDERWQARAEAELGEIAYMDGNVTSAVAMFKDAVLSRLLRRDLGAAIFYLAMVGNGLVEAGEPERGLQYCNRAMQLASITKDAGFPFLAYQGKARSLIALHRDTEAQGVLDKALAQARTQENRAAETQLLIVAGHQAAAEDTPKAIKYLKAASELSETSGFQHAFAWSALELAKAYRAAGDLANAESYAGRALIAMRDTDDKYHLPQHLALLADLEATRGKFLQAHQLYEQATDVIDGLLVNVPSQQIESSLIATLSLVMSTSITSTWRPPSYTTPPRHLTSLRRLEDAPWRMPCVAGRQANPHLTQQVCQRSRISARFNSPFSGKPAVKRGGLCSTSCLRRSRWLQPSLRLAARSNPLLTTRGRLRWRICSALCIPTK
jgi:tetratricopeptide (TPR) repeat protein